MLTLVIGGAASGKSEYAEQLACAGGAAHRVYIATMRPFDAECEARIAKHRAARAGRGFETVERYTGLSGAPAPSGADVLLECMSNLAANELFSPDGAGEGAFDAILAGVDRLCAVSHSVTVVSNDLFADGEDYDPDTLRYLDLLGRVNRALAARAGRVAEVVYTIPVWRKGGTGCGG